MDPDPRPYPYPFQPNEKLNYTFYRKFQFTGQNIENYDNYDADAKDKTMKTGAAVNK